MVSTLEKWFEKDTILKRFVNSNMGATNPWWILKVYKCNVTFCDLVVIVKPLNQNPKKTIYPWQKCKKSREIAEDKEGRGKWNCSQFGSGFSPSSWPLISSERGKAWWTNALLIIVELRLQESTFLTPISATFEFSSSHPRGSWSLKLDGRHWWSSNHHGTGLGLLTKCEFQSLLSILQ
jgi:hypothetical protein